MTTAMELCERVAELAAMTEKLRVGFEEVEKALIEAEVRVMVETALPSGGKLVWRRESNKWGLYILPMLPPFRATPLLKAPRKLWNEAAAALSQLFDQMSTALVERTEQCDVSIKSVEMALSWLQKGEK